MKFNKDWTKKNDVELKNFHECEWEESCVMCKNFNECELEKKVESNDKYKVELWVFGKIVDVFKTDDFEIVKEKFKTWFSDFDSNCNKGHSIIYIDDKQMSIEWTYENILNVNNSHSI